MPQKYRDPITCSTPLDACLGDDVSRGGIFAKSRESACETVNKKVGAKSRSGALRDLCAFTNIFFVFFGGVRACGRDGQRISV